VDTYAVYLRPRGALYSEVHSGTLFGAICWAIRTLGLADLPALLEGFNADPPFVVSSAFLCLWSGEARVRFYPKPCIPELTSEQVRQLAKETRGSNEGEKDAKWRVVERAKRLQKAGYVSEALFEELVTGRTHTADLWRRWKDTGLRARDVEYAEGVLLTTGERQALEREGRLWTFAKEQDVQRNQIDRVAGATGEGLLFFERQTFLRPGQAGLWFLLRTRDRGMMEAAFRYLADTGIGGRRSSGKRQFEIKVDKPYSLPEADDADAFVVLSLYLPKDGEWDRAGEPLSYELVNLRGKHESRFPARLAEGEKTQRVYKELVRPFAPGSIFPLGKRQPWYGQAVSVGQIGEREVWQNGLALPVFARMGGVA
jgi:CRISPR-associated protein Csm4